MSKINKIVVLSGKGGTGKTTLSAAFALMAQNKIVVDCDVDAADLFLVLDSESKSSHEFIGGRKAKINSDLCNACGLCESSCRFNAIHDFTVDQIACEGCGFCYRICPESAIDFDYVVSGNYYKAELTSDQSPFYYASLLPGEGNSGKLVSELKKEAEEKISDESEYVIVDGPPGIGCPVNASVSQMDIAVIITEPTLTGLHDLKRIVELTKKFGIESFIVVNKFDLNLDMTNEIEKYAAAQGLGIIGNIHFDHTVVEALREGKTIMEYPESVAGKEVINIWKNLTEKTEDQK